MTCQFLCQCFARPVARLLVGEALSHDGQLLDRHGDGCGWIGLMEVKPRPGVVVGCLEAVVRQRVVAVLAETRAGRRGILRHASLISVKELVHDYCFSLDDMAEMVYYQRISMGVSIDII